MARYILPVALFCYHSHFFREEVLRYKAVRARLGSNKKRKSSPEEEAATVQVKAEDSESATETVSSGDQRRVEDGTVIKLPDVDPFIFGLFLKFVYTGYYPATVDARPEATRSVVHTTKSTRPDMAYTPARASMPPPANINSRQAPAGEPLPHISILPSENPTMSLQESINHVPVPPSVLAYLLSVQFGAPGFLNQAINHIYYGIGKHFVLGPTLVHYIWSNTLPHPFCSSSPLRKLVLDVMTVHWSSTSTHIVAKQPVLHRLWNQVLDLHRDLRHEFTMGLQGERKVLPVQAYFVDTCVPKPSAREAAKELEAQVVNTDSMGDLSAAMAAATAAAKEQEGASGQVKE
jgi:hypothetical protein